jgi:hypothetical protein
MTMDTAFKVAYSLVVAILFILFVILGLRTFYDEPDDPIFPPTSPQPPPTARSIYCDISEDCFVDGRLLTPDVEAELSESETTFLEEQRDFARRQREHEDAREDYFRNVFIFATSLGLVAIAAGLYLFRRVQALPLGLLLGGFGVIIYGWVESTRGPEETLGTGVLFAVVTVGLVAVLGAGYWFLGGRARSGGNHP